MATLDKAIILAATYHEGQKDKGGVTYILHPIRVMLRCQTVEEQMAAVLHDVLEDTACTIDDLTAAGFSTAVVEAVVCLTRNTGELYYDFIVRCKTNPIARAVKIADMLDNMNVSRLNRELTDKDRDRLKKYHRAFAFLCE